MDWVEDKYAALLTSIGEHLFGRRFTLSVQYQGNGKAASVPASIDLAPPSSAPRRPAPRARRPCTPARAPRDAPHLAPLNPRYTFDRFVVGNNNQLAAAAAHGVAEAPARLYNPLFIYGGVGLGKTHLMHAIGHALLERDPGKRVMYLSSERFTNELVSAIQDGTMAEFRRQYRACDLLLVDDIQFLEGKERTQEEFFHTFNALHDAQRQIVLTSDRPPSATGLEDRLVSRFEWGMVADIKPPDFETRVAILRRKVEEDGLVIHDADEVLAFIAKHRTSSVREIEGAMIKLLAYSSLTRRPIDLSLAREALGVGPQVDGGGGVSAGGITPQRVRDKVAARLGNDRRGAAVQEAHQGPDHPPPGGHVPDQGDVRPVAGGDRQAVRRARPQHRHPLHRQGRGGHGRGPGVPPARGASCGTRCGRKAVRGNVQCESAEYVSTGTGWSGSRRGTRPGERMNSPQEMSRSPANFAGLDRRLGGLRRAAASHGPTQGAGVRAGGLRDVVLLRFPTGRPRTCTGCRPAPRSGAHELDGTLAQGSMRRRTCVRQRRGQPVWRVWGEVVGNAPAVWERGRAGENPGFPHAFPTGGGWRRWLRDKRMKGERTGLSTVPTPSTTIY